MKSKQELASIRELNRKHKEIKKECLGYMGPIEKVYELHISNKPPKVV